LKVVGVLRRSGAKKYSRPSPDPPPSHAHREPKTVSLKKLIETGKQSQMTKWLKTFYDSVETLGRRALFITSCQFWQG
jgi:hypothetical protein